MVHGVFFLAVAVTALLFALVEIQVEGADGWAAKLPTWRVENRWTRIFYGGRPLTGYHLWVQLFVLAMVHVPVGMGFVAPGLAVEARVLAFMGFFWILEDFLWFVINPAYGISKFRAEHVPWHGHQWWWFMPRDYWLFLPLAGLLYWLSHSPLLAPVAAF